MGREYSFDGDGITSRMNLDDPIAYKWENSGKLFYLVTFMCPSCHRS